MGWRWATSPYFLGAFYLFFINTVFIGLATLVGTRMLKFRQITLPDADSMRKVKRYIVVIVVLTMLPASYMTWLIIRQSIAQQQPPEICAYRTGVQGHADTVKHH